MSARVEDVLTKLKVSFNPKPRGGWLWGLCPYHDDHDPSWRIRITDRRYGQHVCFSCKSGGTLLDLVIHALQLKPGPLESEVDVRKRARKWLGECEQNPTPEEELPEILEVREDTVFKTVFMREDTGRDFILPREIEFGTLDTWPTPVRAYVEKRGITAHQVINFAIGYATYGRLAGRIALVTWKRHRDDVFIAQSYQARDFSEASRTRYLYPRENEHPNLDVMFGEHLWRERRTIVVTEGAFNALAVDRLRIPNVSVGALGGSFIRPAHVLKLAAFERVVVLTDSDPAGDKAADALHTALCRHAKVVRARLPEEVDANDAHPDLLWRVVNTALHQTATT